MMNQQEPQIIDFGPYRIIGMNYKGNDTAGMQELWGSEDGFLARMGEINALPGDMLAFGLCRCLPGVSDGSFEYIAGIAASDDASIPDRMMEAAVGASKYAVFEVPSLNEISQVWDEAMGWMNTQQEWQSYCDGAEPECSCVEFPSFELYNADFQQSGKLYVYMPVRARV